MKYSNNFRTIATLQCDLAAVNIQEIDAVVSFLAFSEHIRSFVKFPE